MDERALLEEVKEVAPAFKRDFTARRIRFRICHPGSMRHIVEFGPRKPVGTGYLRTLFSGMKPNFRKMIPANFLYGPSAFMRVFLITINFLIAYAMVKTALNIASLSDQSYPICQQAVE